MKSRKNFINGKGFYIALALCLVAVGALTYVSINSTFKDIVDNNNNKLNSITSDWGEEKSKETEKNQSGIPLNNSSKSSTSSSQSDVSSKSQEQSDSQSKPQDSSAQSEILFTMPLTGETINPFSNGELVKSKTMGDWRTHTGVDIKAPVASQVKSTASGVVKQINDDPMWGIMVVIEHPNGYESHYCNLNTKVDVKKGQEVDAGTIIGSVGQTAQIEIALDPHLHFGIKKDGKWIDPLSVMSKL